MRGTALRLPGRGRAYRRLHARIANKLSLAEHYLDSILASDTVRDLNRAFDEAGEEVQVHGGRLGSNLDWLLDRAYRLWNYAGEQISKR